MKTVLGLGVALFLVIGLTTEFYATRVTADPDLASELAAAMGVNLADLVDATFSVDEQAGAVVSGTVGFLTPIEGDTFVMISSGTAQPMEFPDGWAGTPTDVLNVINGNPNGTGPSGELACDIATLNLTLNVPEWANSLSFNFQFMSDEYPKFLYEEYNDYFSCLLDGTNIAFDTENNIINVNNNFFNPYVSTEGTAFNATTVLLTSKAQVTGGTTVKLDFIVGDVADEILDSAVFLDNFHFSTEEIEDATTEPTGTGAGYVVFEEAHLPIYTVRDNPAYEATEAYSEFADHLIDNGYIVSTINPGTAIDSDVLAPVDVLVICAPQNSYSTAEIDAIETWVKGGGRLLLISEWGSLGAVTSTIASRFNVTLKLDTIRDTDENLDPTQDYRLYYDGANLLSHPITAGVTRVEIYGSDGIVSEPAGEIPLIVTDLDGTGTWDDYSPALGVSVMSAFDGGTAGSGRLVVITDSNIWDSACDKDNDTVIDFYDSDNEVLALNTIDWLAPDINEPPVAFFADSPYSSVNTGENITFDASGSYDPDGLITSYFWDFDDGTNDTGETVIHAYGEEGVYNVTLTVTDNKGENASASLIKIVSDVPTPVHNLDTGLDYPTIQAAIDAPETLAGHTVFVDSGTYHETVDVTKPISLVGEDRGNTVIDGDGALTVIAVSSDGVSISGFTVTGSHGEQGQGGGGIVVFGVGNVQINNVVVCNSEADWGVHLVPGSHDVNITGTDIIDNSRGGLLLNANQRVNVSGNSISNNGEAGISIGSSSLNTVSGNNISNNGGVGVYLDESHDNTFHHNNFIDNPTQVSNQNSALGNLWDDGSEGNYWSDYSGTDSNSDGIGDTAYIIDENNRDNYPVMPTFQKEYTLTVTIVGSGSVTKNPDQASYVYNTSVTLTAIPDSNWTFSGWSGDMSGSANPITIIMNEDKSVTATFTRVNTPPHQPQLSVTSLTVGNNDNLAVTVTGPTPADPEGDSVTYTYRWFVDAGTGEFVDDEAAGRGDHTGNVVSAEDTSVGDVWKVEVTPTDENGATGPYAVATWQVASDTTKPLADSGQDQTVDEENSVTFSGSGSWDNDEIVSYVWTFTDVTPKTLTGMNPTYNFTNPGVYVITLNVTDAEGNWNTDTCTITVKDITPPIAEAGMNQTSATDSTVSFDAGGSSDNVGINKYEWDFGDGTTGTGKNVTHTYKEAGNYTVTLTVEDEAGNRITDSCIITVEMASASEEVEREPRSLYSVALVAVFGSAVVVASSIAASSGTLGLAIHSAVSKLPIPDWLKDFLRLYGKDVFETVDRKKLAAMKKAPLISKGEMVSILISATTMTVVFCFIEANGLPRFLNPSVLVVIVPYVLLAVLMENVVEVFAEALCARICKVYRQVKLWLYGFTLFLISSLLFGFPTGSPIITRYQSGKISNRKKGLLITTKLLMLLTLALPFAGLYMLGFTILGDTGLLMTLMTVFYYCIPLKPIVGKAVFDYKKWLSVLALVSTGILFFGFALNLLPHIVYLVTGAVSLVLVTITLYLLSKH